MSGTELAPRSSRSSSNASSSSFSSRNKANLTLDLSDLPPLSQPTPPSNTLLFTNLNNIDIFRPDNIGTIRDLVAQTAPIHAFAPLKSFRRIIISFFDEESAILVRKIWDGEPIMGERLKIYFGQPTPIQPKDEHLTLPDAGKLFFISPPPSPPAGWEVRLEDAPNKQVHAEDLADALAQLRHGATPATPDNESPLSLAADPPSRRGTRSRSSTLIYRPDDHGGSPDLPAVVVEDMTDEPEEISPMDTSHGPIIPTTRPPVELMHDA